MCIIPLSRLLGQPNSAQHPIAVKIAIRGRNDKILVRLSICSEFVKIRDNPEIEDVTSFSANELVSTGFLVSRAFEVEAR
jgi:hypothetical protein